MSDRRAADHRVVVNHEEQYSVWPGYLELPAGWRAEGTTGSERECLDRVDRIWTDMRPLGARTTGA